ncbi:uncharacterized protein LOC134727086 [Mytilus trossulus]|uniref:uncharacterized protein LOC134727086 n=1 Tax=Mytilus trossulus TaxID=6551 RepID=UPI003003C68D
MAIYKVLIHCTLLFIWVAKHCSGQGRCSSLCLNGGTCNNSLCICLDRYTGRNCEYEYFDIQLSRTIHLETANESSDLSIPYFNKSIDTKTSLYFKIESEYECNVTFLQEGGHRTVQIIMKDKEIDDMIIRNDSIIHISFQFRKFNISIRREQDGFTLGTVQKVDRRFLRKTIYTEGKITNQAIFSSARKTEWTFYEADAVTSMSTKIFENPALICPILPQYNYMPLHVIFLNRSLQCSGKIGIETTCSTRGINIEYKCSEEREKCSDFNDILWIAACHTTTDRDCKSCKIRNYKRYIPKICQNFMTIVTDDSVIAADNCFEASKYLILWHEIRDVFSQDQSSSQRPLPTAKDFTTTFSDSESYTSEQSPSTRSLHTTRSATPTFNNDVSFTSTGLIVGASVSAAIIVILLICLLVILRRRSIETKSAKKNQPVHNFKDGNDHTGRQNIGLSIQGDLTEYNDLAMYRDSHQYEDLKSARTKPQETSYDYIDPHIHKQEPDNCKTDKINSTKNACAELIHDYLVFDPNEKKVASNIGRDLRHI